MKRPTVIALAVAMLLTVSQAGNLIAADEKPEDKKMDLKVGDEAPEFKAVNEEGKQWKSTDYVGKKIVVVYFYPADFTGGCTAQACGFRDDMADLTKEGVEVVGVSGDSAETHKLFKQHHKLNFTLLADEKGEIAKKFGVPVRSGASITQVIDGQERTLTRGVTASRWTFVIGPDGKVAYKDTNVMAAKDSKSVQKVVEELKSQKNS